MCKTNKKKIWMKRSVCFIVTLKLSDLKVLLKKSINLKEKS